MGIITTKMIQFSNALLLIIFLVEAHSFAFKCSPLLQHKSQITTSSNICDNLYFPSYAKPCSPVKYSSITSPLLYSSSSPSDVEEYKNAATKIFSKFMQRNDNMDDNIKSGDEEKNKNILASIDFNAPKIKKIPIQTLAQALDYELYTKEWFVTGNVNPIYFSEKFEFQDPDVKLSGIENYAKGVNTLFDQETSRAEVISVVVNDVSDKEDYNVITVTWRLSGRVNIGPGDGLPIKPYICYTDFRVEKETGLIYFQEDKFDIPQWDILLSALFPFLIGKVTSPPAKDVERSDIPIMPKISSNFALKGDMNIFDIVNGMFQK